jgi:2-polyprenyl-3-methyl-5-hydroxy-6-metoxy-1,4-benzoquinol methylase
MIRLCPNCGGTSQEVRFIEQDFRIVRCKDCGLTFLENPPENESLYEEYYTAVPDSGREYCASSSNPLLAETYSINEQGLRLLKKIKNSRTILDIGCGLGLFLKSAAEADYSVYGIDVSARALSFAKEESNIQCERKNLDELLVQHRKFDIITLWHVLEHFLDPLAEFKKILMLLNDGGVCIIEVSNLHSIEFMLSRTKWKGGNHPLYHRTFFTSQTLNNMLKSSGFTVTRRLQLNYRIPKKSVFHFPAKRLFNLVAMDWFLDFAAFK